MLATVNIIIIVLDNNACIFLLAIDFCILNPKTFTVSHLVTQVRRAHRRMVGAQSNLAGGQDIFARIMYEKLEKMPDFYTTFVRKMPEFYIMLARKKYFPGFFSGGGGVVGEATPLPLSPTPMAGPQAPYQLNTALTQGRCIKRAQYG